MKIVVLCHILHRTRIKVVSHRRLAVMAKKCTKKRAARAELLFCLFKAFFTFVVVVVVVVVA